MNESEWLACGEPERMLPAVRATASDRKLRLFAAACWYRVWADQFGDTARAAVELFVGHVDGTVSPTEWFEGFTAAGGINLGKHFRLLICTDPMLAAVESARFAARDVAWRLAWDAVEVDVHAGPGVRAAQSNWRSRYREDVRAREETVQAGLLREVFGNPFRPVSFRPEWRTDTAVSLAGQMYAARDFSAAPILADALQDAGCDCDPLLAHLRDVNQNHVRGCWALDLVLNRS